MSAPAAPLREFTKEETDEAIAEFNYILGESQLNGWEVRCLKKPEEYTDYAKTPSREQAKALCEKCPAKATCLLFAEVTRAKTGVFGGVAWHDGRPAENSEETRERLAKSA